MSRSDEARELLRELLAEAMNGNGHGGAPPAIPAPPVAAVLRPSTWSQPPAPGEVIGDGAVGEPVPAGSGARVEAVSLRSDADLARFVGHVLANAAAIRGGGLRFTLGSVPGGVPVAPAGGVRRVERGAVTERIVNEAATAGQRLVLAPAAVLTPLARERARHLKVEIERERRC